MSEISTAGPMAHELLPPDEPDELRKLVQRHQVCWSVWPENLIVGPAEGKRVQVGFDIDLYGTHEHPQREPRPGCDECLKVWHVLERIAHHVQPQEHRPSRYEINHWRPSLGYSRERKDRPDVTLTLKILHREDFDQPVDPCEVRCLREIERSLKALGVRRDRWCE